MRANIARASISTNFLLPAREKRLNRSTKNNILIDFTGTGGHKRVDNVILL